MSFPITLDIIFRLIFGINDALSERRANRVRDYLLNSGIPGGEVSVKGMGEGSPIADNNTRSGRAKNRRVVIEAR